MAVALALIGLLSATSRAVTTNWTNNSGGSFTTAGNWDNSVPGSDDLAVFRRGNIAPYQMLFYNPIPFPLGSPIHPTINRLIVGTNTVDFASVFVPSTLTVESVGRGGIGGPIGGDMIIGQTATDVAVLNMNLANLTVDDATLGSAAGSSGTLNITGSTRSFNVTGATGETYDLVVGSSGTGAINVSGGADVSAGVTVLGLNAGSTGTVNITNADSTWTGSLMAFGYSGNGTLNVSDGGTLNSGLGFDSNGTLNVTSGGTINGGGYIRSGTANVTGANSTWTGSHIEVDMQGTLNISNGGRVSETSPFNVGYNGGGSVHVASGGRLSTGNVTLINAVQHGGQVSVTDAGSSWLNFGELSVTSIGRINISAGGHFENDNGDAHIYSGGHVTVEGAGSNWTTSGHALIVESGGTLTVSDGGTIFGGVLVSGSGILKGNGSTVIVINDGIVAPGDSLGALHVNPLGYTQHSTGSLQIELGGTTPDSEYDQLLVAGDITLDGMLQVSLVNSFAPAIGDSFNILDWDGTRTGQFANVNLPTLGGGLGWDASQLYTTGVLSVVLLGDYNDNGVVDAADYTVWRNNLGSGTSLPNDDTAGVGQDDYVRWKTNFGQIAGSGSAGASPSQAAVPEPAGLILACCAVLCAAAVVASRATRRMDYDRSCQLAVGN